MKPLLLSALVSLALAPLTILAADQVWINNGIINGVNPGRTTPTNIDRAIPPQIDAITVINNGSFGLPPNLGAIPPEFPIITETPFEMADMLNLTNTGGMFSVVGWLFDNSPASSGLRQWAANFFNANTGDIEAIDIGATITIGSLNSGVVTPSYLLIDATNIVNRGLLMVGANGLLRLTGNNISLAHSSIAVAAVPEEALGSVNGVFTNYFVPDVAIYDQYWATTNFSDNDLLDTRSIWSSNNVANSQPIDSPPARPVPIDAISIVPSIADSYTNILGALDITFSNVAPDLSPLPYTVNIITNINKGALFVSLPFEFQILDGFRLGVSNFDTAAVLLALPRTNAATGVSGFNFIYFEDTLASQPGHGLLINALNNTTLRPTNYLVDRLGRDPGPAGNNGYPQGDFFVNSGNIRSNYPPSTNNIVSDLVTNFTVNNQVYAAYSPFIDDVVSRPPTVVGGTITNLPGSIKITAENLDLTGARFSANGQVTIQAMHLTSSTNLIIDCENLNFDVGATNGTLKVQNLAQSNVGGRIRGPIRVWSAEWTNTSYLLITNNYAFTNFTDTNGQIHVLVDSNSPVTIAVGVGYHAFIMDASALVSSFPVVIYDFDGRGRHVDIQDDMTVLESLLIEGRSLVLDSVLTIPGQFPPSNPINNTVFPGIPLADWRGTNAPRLQFFTNNGALLIANEAHFGDDRSVPYSAFVNVGTVNAASIDINSSFFEAGGALAAQGTIVINCKDGKLSAGSSAAGNSSRFFADTLKFYNYQLSSGGSLDLAVTNALFDAGPGSGNQFQLQNGFNLLVKPATGDLLGTAITTSDTTITGKRILHTWAGADRGPSSAGFTNNVALGTLTLSSQNGRSTFVFGGTGAQNALYVDVLDLTTLGANFENEIEISPNLVVYYAAAQLGFTPPPTNGIPVEPEEFLDGKFGGHLRWVQTFAGPDTSPSHADVVVSTPAGQTSIPVNFALRWSQVIDSDGDGIANGLQQSPFKVATAAVQVKGQGAVIPDYDGQLLLAGLTYGVIAQPADGFVFTGWTGDITSNVPELTFVMPTNGLSLTANFAYGVAPGSYSGLFYETLPNGIELQRSGAFTVTTTKAGSYSGSLQLLTKHYSFSGKLAGGAGTASIAGGTLTVRFNAGFNDITGTVSNANWTALLDGHRNLSGSSSNAPAQPGKFTIAFAGTGDPGDTVDPQGSGYGSVNLSSSGKVRLSGTLGDGTRITQTATISQDGEWPLYVPLYNGKGQMLSWLSFASVGDRDVGGVFNWIKQPNPKNRLFPEGFNFDSAADGCAYDPAANPITVFANGALVLSGGSLTNGITNNVSVDSKNKISLSGDKSRFTVKKPQGLFTGSVMDPATGKPIKFNGALLQKQAFGFGHFLGTNQSGSVILGP